MSNLICEMFNSFRDLNIKREVGRDLIEEHKERSNSSRFVNFSSQVKMTSVDSKFEGLIKFELTNQVKRLLNTYLK